MKIKFTYRPQQSLWLKKNISKALVFGLLLNNIYINSNASDIEIQNRYETLEGEYITIDNSTEGELHEIEIFGNTVQDENNLEDIQSVGDLYVDEDGSPILDKQGREQYKIDITSSNINNLLINSSSKFVNNLGGDDHTIGISIIDKTDTSFKVISSTRKYYAGANLRIKCEIGKTYQIKAKSKITYGNSLVLVSGHSVNSGWRNEKDIEQIHDIKFVANSEEVDIVFYVLQSAISENNGVGIVDYYDVSIYEYEDKDLNFEDLKSNKTTILLPTQLQKVGNIADRLYWDNEKKRYVIEKNIGEELLTGDSSELWTKYGGFTPDINLVSGFQWRQFANVVDYETKMINSYTKNARVYDSTTSSLQIIDNKSLAITVPLVDVPQNTDSFREYLSLNNITVLFKLKEPQLIETNITSKLKIPTYEGKTHIYVQAENGVSPTLKVTVDRLGQIAKTAIEEAKINPTTENISLARIYINMLPESTYKDQLQEQLSEVFNTEITLDKKSATANLDIYIKSENMLFMSLDTNSITFENYSGVDEIEKTNAVEISINSSLPYQLNAYLLDEMYNSDKSKKIDMDRLQIKDNTDSEYKEFTAISEKLVLKDNCESGNDKIHNIDLKLKGGNAYESDIYKTVIKFEAEQK